MSYSVCDGFPNAAVADWSPPAADGDDEPDFDVWYEMDAAERWRLALAGLRAKPGKLELRPDGFADYRFGHGLTVLDLLAPDFEERLAAVFEVSP